MRDKRDVEKFLNDFNGIERHNLNSPEKLSYIALNINIKHELIIFCFSSLMTHEITLTEQRKLFSRFKLLLHEVSGMNSP